MSELNYVGCKMCNFPIEDIIVQTNHSIHNKGDFDKLAIDISLLSGGITKQPYIRFEAVTKDKIYSSNMEIQYCPFCGKKLSEKNPEIIKTAIYKGGLYRGNL